MKIINYNTLFQKEMENIRVMDYQAEFVSSFGRCLEIHNSTKDATELLSISDADDFIGYALLRNNYEYQNIFIWQFAIDKSHQNMGKGSKAFKSIIEMIHSKHPYRDIVISIKHNNDVMKHLCTEIGFIVFDENEQEIDYILKTKVNLL